VGGAEIEKSRVWSDVERHLLKTVKTLIHSVRGCCATPMKTHVNFNKA
jgi:hypothetical protein